MIQTITETNGNRLICHEYEDFQELVDAALSDLSLIQARGGYKMDPGRFLNSRQNLPAPSWDGGAGFDGAARMLTTDGYPKGLKEVRKIAESMSGLVGAKIIRHEARHDVSGAALDIGAYMTGEPECFLDFEDQSKDGVGRIITIGMCLTRSCGVSSQKILNGGAAVIALVDLLESVGHRVEIFTSAATGKQGVCIDPRVLAKGAMEHVDQNRLAFIACHSAFLRRIIFSLYEQFPEEFRGPVGVPHGNYGFPMDAPGVRNLCDIYIPANFAFNDLEQAVSWVRKMLLELGVELEE